MKVANIIGRWACLRGCDVYRWLSCGLLGRITLGSATLIARARNSTGRRELLHRSSDLAGGAFRSSLVARSCRRSSHIGGIGVWHGLVLRHGCRVARLPGVGTSCSRRVGRAFLATSICAAVEKDGCAGLLLESAPICVCPSAFVCWP